MRYAVNSDEMKMYDRNTTEYYGIPEAVLMERASLLVTSHILDWIKEKGSDRKFRALIIAGTGNNGADGVCIGRLLSQKGVITKVCVVGDMTKASSMLISQLKTYEKYGGLTDTFSNIRDNKNGAVWDIIVDAVFGIGLSRPVSGDQLLAVNYINDTKNDRKSDLFVVSVDIPSGISADDGSVLGCAVKADVTVTFNQTKLGHIMYPGFEYTGLLFVEDAGITDESFLGKDPKAFFYDEELSELLPYRKPDSNKGSCGKLLIIAGSREVSGACILCATAAFKAGCGMVKIFTPEENREAIKTLLPEAMLDTYGDYEPWQEKLRADFEWSTAVVIGPGIGTGSGAAELVRQTLAEYNKDLVIDADALNLIAMDPQLRTLLENYTRDGRRAIITPHLGEFARLMDRNVKDCKQHLLQYPRELAKNLHCSVVCKDARTVVADENERKSYVNVSGNDGMATAGSGDVLAGVMGAFLSWKESSFDTACIAVYTHGKAGDIAESKNGRYSMMASDIIDGIETVLKDI